MNPARDTEHMTAEDHVRIAILSASRMDRIGFQCALDRLAKAFPLARKDMDRRAMAAIATMRNWLRADMRKVPAINTGRHA